MVPLFVLGVRDTPTSLRPEFRVLNTDFVKDCKCVKKDQTIPIKGPSFVDIDAQKKKLQRATQNALKFEFDTLEKEFICSSDYVFSLFLSWFSLNCYNFSSVLHFILHHWCCLITILF